jgi:hypothetical protein
MKRPAAAAAKAVAKATTGMKRPAAAKTAIPKATVAKSATWKNIHSKIYHVARDAAFKRTGNDAKAKAAASEACARAKVKFLKGTLKL